MSSDQTPTKVAIACQGGGSHTAFTAGVLEQFLDEQASGRGDYEITALTGTSGGAMCAVLTWYGLRTGGGDASEERAGRLLDGFWSDLEATTPPERLVNGSVVWGSRLLNNGFPLWELPPDLNPAAHVGQQWLRRTLGKYLDGPPLEDLLVDPEAADPLPSPTLLVSAVNVTDGGFDIFTDRPGVLSSDEESGAAETDPRRSESRVKRAPLPISVDAVIASAAVPPLFDAVELQQPGGSTKPYWDGLLSQNPPVRDLLAGPRLAAEKPDEIWVIRINPTEQENGLGSLEAIEDRRNELAGSLSLRQELYFIEQVNRWLQKGMFTDEAATEFKPVTVRQLELDEDRLDYPGELVRSTKLNRDGIFLSKLRELGARQAREFLRHRDETEYVLVRGEPDTDSHGP